MYKVWFKLSEITPMFFSFNSTLGACPLCHGLGYENLIEETSESDELIPCKACGGLRLKKEALGIKLQGINIGEFSRLSVKRALEFINNLSLSEREGIIAGRIIKEARDRLHFLRWVGLDYLTLDRPAATLSGGEAQRIRLSTQLGSSLTGVLYVLDEPSIGLHPRDCRKLLETLSGIRDAENTVIIVEHDADTIMWADYVVDLGPGGGRSGGWVVAEGTPQEIQEMESSPTGQYLSGRKTIPLPSQRRRPKDYIKITGITEHNLKGLDIKDTPRYVCLLYRCIRLRQKHACPRYTLQNPFKGTLRQQGQPRQIQDDTGYRETLKGHMR